jgi:hypothetical protein
VSLARATIRVMNECAHCGVKARLLVKWVDPQTRKAVWLCLRCLDKKGGVMTDDDEGGFDAENS